MTDDDSRSSKVLGLELLCASLLVLFQELTLIRWLPGQVRVLAYFPNVVLIAAFLGLGIGSLRSRSRPLLWMWPLALSLLTLVAAGMSRFAFTQESASEHLWLLYYDMENAPVIPDVRAPIVLLFVLTALTFLPLGQYVACRLEAFRGRSLSLKGYSWDLGGSLLGSVAFAVVSFTWARPWVWFLGVLVLAAPLCFRLSRTRVTYLVSLVVLMMVAFGTDKNDVYSPYYAIRVIEQPDKWTILTNGSMHQSAIALRDVDPDGPNQTRSGYHHPYDQLLEKPKKVLVLGAGSGNDVAVALDEGVERVDAVEIDPAIIDVGRQHHPNQPYSDDRVRVINTDARSYLNDTDETYDLIVFGTLDSMTRLSALSSVRLDNFVYTRECIEAAKRRLNPEGGMALYFMVGSPSIHLKLSGMLTEVFDQVPVSWNQHHGLFNRIFMIGPAFEHLPDYPTAQMTKTFKTSLLPSLDIPSDDWPYLYLDSRSVSSFYLSLMFMFLIIAVLSVTWASPAMRTSFVDGGADWEMFLYGLAFLLIETKFITEMSLVWGATWLTSAVVFASVLSMVLAATLLNQKWPLGWGSSVAGLIASLLVNYFLPTDVLVGREVPVRLLLSALFVGAPIFFASTCFALRFRERARVDLAFGWNLLGAVVGGLLEFTAMLVGMRALSLIGLIAYLGAFLLATRSGRAVDELATRDEFASRDVPVAGSV